MPNIQTARKNIVFHLMVLLLEKYITDLKLLISVDISEVSEK